ncbi:Hypothetical Protein FCC1311_008742 [Hondaea fermentalgiana]|uniref:Sulfotransferase domain-containing protein n=1 Tax=Hondaea fermentalgiana TaxID=2315210 RepID=A0A2R5G0W3_9STRA|nr:Hypothetical Protein FCC1311_008742 [Hondaea fermentalgiana]|eukprot:GBG24656.1 Hypothetical Protein FCC1311_008742 [Hondaea fermentalgiana]
MAQGPVRRSGESRTDDALSDDEEFGLLEDSRRPAAAGASVAASSTRASSLRRDQSGWRLPSFTARIVLLAGFLMLVSLAALASVPEYRSAIGSKSSEMLASLQASLRGQTETDDGDNVAPSQAPTTQYLTETRPTEAKPDWKDKSEGKRKFKEQSGTCYFRNIIRRVNNRPGHHLNCYAACTGINLRLRANQADRECVGWTMVRKIACEPGSTTCDQVKVGSNTCLLHHRFESEGSYQSEACVSGKLLKRDLVLGKRKNKGSSSSSSSSSTSDGTDFDLNATDSTDNDSDSYDNETLGSSLTVEDFARTCPARFAAVGDVKRPLRVFVACLQASGCTLLSYLLAQRDRTASILDVGVRQELPPASFYKFAEAGYPNIDTIVLKYPMRGSDAISPDAWIANVKDNFKPDVTLLFLRNPVDMYLHLINHVGTNFANAIPSDADLARCEALKGDDSYGLTCGSPESKLRAINQVYRDQDSLGVSAIVRFEDICNDRLTLKETLEGAGICIDEADLRQPKWSVVDVMRFSLKYFPSGKSKGGIFWGPGDLRNTFHNLAGDRETEERAYRLCKKELSTNVRIKLLAHSVAPFSGMSLSDVDDVVAKAAPDIVEAYKV